MAIPLFPQFHLCTAQFVSDQQGRVLVRFHSNYIIVRNGVVQTAFNANVPLAVPPPQNAFRIESQNAAGLWTPAAFNANLRAYIMLWGSDFRIVIGQRLWELWRPQLQMSRQAFGPGNHNEPYP